MDSNDLDIGRLQQLASMLQQPSPPSPSVPHAASESSQNRPLDPEYLRILRSLLPFLDFSYQKHLGIMLKLMELQYTLDYYQMEPCRAEEDDPDPPEQKTYKILQSVRDACDPAKRSIFDMMLNAMRVQDMMHKAQTSIPQNTDAETSPDSPPVPAASDDITAKLKQDLTPEQKGMFDMLTSILGSHPI